MNRHECKILPIQAIPKSILLIAYDLKAKGGSEGGAGASALRAHLLLGNHVKVLTRFECQPEEFGQSNGKVEIVTLEIPAILKKVVSFFPFKEQFRYILWNIIINFELLKIVTRDYFDYIHHATYSGDWNPCPSLLMRRKKVVWGPIGGAQQIPTRHLTKLGMRGLIRQILYLLVTSQMRKINRYLSSLNHVHVLTVNQSTKAYFEKMCRTTMVNQISFPPNHFLSFKKEHSDHKKDPKIILGVGRLIPLKFWNLLLEAIAELPEIYNLELIGDGPDLHRLQKLARKLNIEKRVRFLGSYDYNATMLKISNAHTVAFPSMKDSSPWVVAEALSLGAHVIAFDVDGVRQLVGKKFSLTSIGVHPSKNLAISILRRQSAGREFNFCICEVANVYSEVFV